MSGPFMSNARNIMTTEPKFPVEASGFTVQLDPSFLMELGDFAEGEEVGLRSSETLLVSVVRLYAAAEVGRSFSSMNRTDMNRLMLRARAAGAAVAEHLRAARRAATMKEAEAIPLPAGDESFSLSAPQVDPAFAPLVACALGKPVEEASAPEMLLAISSLGLAADELRSILSAQGSDLAALAKDRGATFSLWPH